MGETGAVERRFQQQHVVGVDHRRNRRGAVLLPHRAAVERLQRCFPARHVGEPADPHEPVRVVEIAELADDVHAVGLLGLDELAVEQLDQVVAPGRVQRVLPELDHRAATVRVRAFGRDHLLILRTR